MLFILLITMNYYNHIPFNDKKTQYMQHYYCIFFIINTYNKKARYLYVFCITIIIYIYYIIFFWTINNIIINYISISFILFWTKNKGLYKII